MTIHYKIGDHDNRPWGTWAVLAVGAHYIIKQITVMPDKILSLQLHHHRNEHWIIIQGQARVTLGEKEFSAQQNDQLFIPAETKHRIANIGQEPLIFIEIQTGAILDETDIVRFADAYGRN